MKLTHCGQVMLYCVIIGSGNGLGPVCCQPIISTKTNADLLSIGPTGINFSQNLENKIQFFSQEIPLNKSSVKWQPFCSNFNVSNIDLF